MHSTIENHIKLFMPKNNNDFFFFSVSIIYDLYNLYSIQYAKKLNIETQIKSDNSVLFFIVSRQSCEKILFYVPVNK